MRNYTTTEGNSHRFVIVQSLFDTWLRRESFDQHHRIVGGFGDAGTAVWARHIGRVTDNRYALKGQARRLHVIDGLQKRLIGNAPAIAELRSKHTFGRL